MASLRDRPAAVAAGLCAGAIALGGAVTLVPALLHDGTAVSSTPIRRDQVARDVMLAPGQHVCVSQVALDRDSAVARLFVRELRAPGTSVRIAVAAPGYRAGGNTAIGPRTASADGTRLDVRFAPPPRSSVGTVCLESSGPRTLVLVGTDQARALTRSTASLDGTPLRRAPSLTLLEAHKRSALARTPELIDRAAALSPFGPWFFWVLLPLLLLLVPAFVVAALYLALRTPETSEGEPTPSPSP